MSYTFAQLLPGRSPGAGSHNADILKRKAYGIEVTEPTLAHQCFLGNLDPQHSLGGSGEAAIEAAVTCSLPPSGASLVTIKPDMDALGAMAIFLLRAQGRTLSPELIGRVAMIAQADRFDFGPWPGVQSLPQTEAEWIAFAREPLGIAPISLLAMDPKIALNERVEAIARWLETGEIPSQYKNATEEKAKELASGFAEGSIAISVCLKGRLALVVGELKDTLRLGYRRAPVVLAIAAKPGGEDSLYRKITVAQYCPGLIELHALAGRLNDIEPGWGGSATIIGSPQGVGSSIPVAQLVAAIEQTLTTAAIDRS